MKGYSYKALNRPILFDQTTSHGDANAFPADSGRGWRREQYNHCLSRAIGTGKYVFERKCSVERKTTAGRAAPKPDG